MMIVVDDDYDDDDSDDVDFLRQEDFDLFVLCSTSKMFSLSSQGF